MFTVTRPQQPQGDPTYVLLGAFGDICIMLPLFWEQSRLRQKPVNVVVAKTYAELFEGCSYVTPIIWPGEYSKVGDAVQFVKRQGLAGPVRFLNPVVVQAYGNQVPRETDSFAKEMWRLADRRDDWDRLPLVFDKRSPEREQALVAAHSSDKPMILVAPEGRSSPFPSRATPDKAILLNKITAEFPDFNVVDLSAVKCERIYDLLGLYDAAALLVSVDTVHLHLSRASKVPVVALCVDQPTPWHGSPHYSNQLVRVKYSEYSAREVEMLRVMRKWLCPPPFPLERCIAHVWSEYGRVDDQIRRHAAASRSWHEEYRFGHWSPTPILNADLGRTSSDIGEPRKIPFIRDIIEKGIAFENGDDATIIVLTNDDTCFVAGLTQQIVQMVESRGSCYAHRWDFNRVVRVLNPCEVRQGKFFAGSDLFAFTVEWWKQHGSEFPDMLAGFEAWDWILRELIKSKGGGELHEAIYHERHTPQWLVERLTSEGNKYNRRLARQWLTERKMDLRELAGID
jgi:hypothetical protein